jgi:hypothetical protein
MVFLICENSSLLQSAPVKSALMGVLKVLEGPVRDMRGAGVLPPQSLHTRPISESLSPHVSLPQLEQDYVTSAGMVFVLGLVGRFMGTAAGAKDNTSNIARQQLRVS